ncbi:Secretory immunoglobulin A-binding protein EsiB [Diplonema papillatum]|nr:Secretory immunoglobulin A-binding protein EsiB [Diplonema papillatum]|eukprot:gene9751-15136_t
MGDLVEIPEAHPSATPPGSGGARFGRRRLYGAASSGRVRAAGSEGRTGTPTAKDREALLCGGGGMLKRGRGTLLADVKEMLYYLKPAFVPDEEAPGGGGIGVLRGEGDLLDEVEEVLGACHEVAALSLEDAVSKSEAAGFSVASLVAVAVRADATEGEDEFRDLTLQAAAEAGCVAAMVELGARRLKSAETLPEALQLLDAAAQAAHPKALYLVSTVLEEARGVPQDLPRSLHYLHRSAGAGYPPALFSLGLKHELGLSGTPRDLSLAFKYYSRGAAARHVDSQLALGKLYLMGEILEDKAVEVRAKAEKWLRMAAGQGSVEAAHLLNHMRKQPSEHDPAGILDFGDD